MNLDRLIAFIDLAKSLTPLITMFSAMESVAKVLHILQQIHDSIQACRVASEIQHLSFTCVTAPMVFDHFLTAETVLITS